MSDVHDFICKVMNNLNVRYIQRNYNESQLFQHAKSIQKDAIGTRLTLRKYPYKTWYEYFKSISQNGLLIDCGLAVQMIHIIFADESVDERDDINFYSTYGTLRHPEDLYIVLSPIQQTLVSHLSECKHMGVWLFSFNQTDYVGLSEHGMIKGDIPFWKTWLENTIRLPPYTYLGPIKDTLENYLLGDKLYLLTKVGTYLPATFHAHMIIIPGIIDVRCPGCFDNT